LNTGRSEHVEQLHDDEAELDRSLDRYLYGDFFIHSRTNTNLCKSASQEQEVFINMNNENDNVKIEYRKNSMMQQNQDKQMDQAAFNNAGGKPSLSTSDETGAVHLLNRKPSQEHVDPDHEAKMLLKNLACKADYTTISKIVTPILSYLDANKPSGWEYSRFVRCVFLILMYNVKQQHAIVIKELIKHLDSHINSSAKLKCHIIKAISTCIRIAAMHSVGTAGQTIEIFTYLLKHLKSSVEKASTLRGQLLTKKVPSLSNQSANSMQHMAAAVNASHTSDTTAAKLNADLSEEYSLQRRIIDAMGQFTTNLPDYSKNDVVMFIARQINSQQFNYVDLAAANSNQTAAQQNVKEQLNSQLRAKYFECLYEICTKYRPTQLFSAFTSVPFIEDILRLTLVNDWASRRKAHEILHHLLDKYQLLGKIKCFKPNLFNELTSSSSGIVIVKRDPLSKSTSSFVKMGKTESNDTLNHLDAHQTKASSTSSLNKTSRNQTYLSQLDLSDTTLTSSKEDVQFMRKYGRIFLAHLNENLFLANNRRENYESIYLTTCLFLIGLYNENEFLVDLVRFGFHVQELALLNYEQTANFSFNSNCNVHKYICAYFILLSKSSNIPALYDYCSEICEMRRKKNLFQFVYPEYVLMESAASGIQSPRTSLNEIETEFKRELKASAKEYHFTVRQLKEPSKDAASQLNDKKGSVSIENLTKSTTNLNNHGQKTAPWLFNKKVIIEILESNGYATASLFTPNSEYSLSVGYLQQTLTSLQTALKYRSPYSDSVESFSNLAFDAKNANLGGSNGMLENPSGNDVYHAHRRGISSGGAVIGMSSGLGTSSSTQQIGSTPRRSLDIDSNQDGDDTSYDSASQYSIDQPVDLDYLNQQNAKLFYIDPSGTDTNQMTVNSVNFLKQNQDCNSFETIRKVLFNGNNNLASGGASLVNANAASLASSANNRSASHFAPNRFNTNNNINEDEDRTSNQSDPQLETSLRIISDFKQKPFDELRDTLRRKNYMNTEKYQQVFEFITKELTGSGATPTNSLGLISNSQTNTTVNTMQPQPVNGLHYTDSNGNLSNLADVANSSYSAVSLSSNPSTSIREAYNQKNIPLNDIEFPQLFMY